MSDAAKPMTLESRTKTPREVIANTLSFFGSCIRCGEPWDDLCQKMMDSATAALANMDAPVRAPTDERSDAAKREELSNKLQETVWRVEFIVDGEVAPGAGPIWETDKARAERAAGWRGSDGQPLTRVTPFCSIDPADLRALLAAPASAQTPAGEVAAWECRHFDPQYGWSPWERIEPRHRLETIEGRVNDIREFIKLGNKYQLRALYAEGEPEGYAHE